MRMECTINECTPLLVTNGTVVGNRLAVGSRVKVQCDVWYNVSFVYSAECQVNGSWSPSLHCEPIYGCGVPPPAIPNAIVEPSNLTDAALYTCDYSYATEDRRRHLLLPCLPSLRWDISYTTFNCVLWDCKPGWHRINDSCYWADANRLLDFTSTQQLCAENGSYVLQLETEEEHVLVKNYLMDTYGPHSWWLGLTDKYSEGEWRWIAENTTAPWTTWEPGEPQNGGCEDYVVLFLNHDWYDECKNAQLNPACEKGIEIIDTDGSV